MSASGVRVTESPDEFCITYFGGGRVVTLEAVAGVFHFVNIRTPLLCVSLVNQDVEQGICLAVWMSSGSA